VTLSPIPGFRKWLEDKIRNNQEGGHFYDGSILPEEELQALEQAGLVTKDDLWQSLLTTLDELDYGGGSSTSSSSSNVQEVIRPILMKLASRYLLLEKHRGKPLDAVTRFHVGNGALVHRLNFAADLTRKGLKSSYGIMVNYRYDLDRLEENQKLYETDYRIPREQDMEQWIVPPRSKL
jgi:malonyl-CoA decarboxylase